MWVKLDDGFFLHPKAQAAGKDGRALFIAGLCWSAGQLTDGTIPKSSVPVIAAMAGVKPSEAKRLVAAGLWHDRGDEYEIHAYLEYQPSGSTVRARRDELSAKRAEAGRRGAESRWSDGNGHGNSMANGMANRWQTDGNSMAPSPSPPLIDLSPPQVCTDPGLPSTDDDHRRTIELLVERRRTVHELAAAVGERRPIKNRAAWSASVRAGLESEYGDRIDADLALGLDPEQIARSLIPLGTDRIPSHATAERIYG